MVGEVTRQASTDTGVLQETVINALKTERDVSVRQRAVDLLYAMCDKSNAEEIVLEMLAYLETADYSIREEMVLKVRLVPHIPSLSFANRETCHCTP